MSFCPYWSIVILFSLTLFESMLFFIKRERRRSKKKSILNFIYIRSKPFKLYCLKSINIQCFISSFYLLRHILVYGYQFIHDIIFPLYALYVYCPTVHLTHIHLKTIIPVEFTRTANSEDRFAENFSQRNCANWIRR